MTSSATRSRDRSRIGLLAFALALGCAADRALAQDPPAITSPTTAAGQVGVPFTYQITSNFTPWNYSASPLPAWASVTPAGLISGTPDSAGTFSCTLKAWYSNNDFAGATLTVTIKPLAPVI